MKQALALLAVVAVTLAQSRDPSHKIANLDLDGDGRVMRGDGDPSVDIPNPEGIKEVIWYLIYKDEETGKTRSLAGPRGQDPVQLTWEGFHLMPGHNPEARVRYVVTFKDGRGWNRVNSDWLNIFPDPHEAAPDADGTTVVRIHVNAAELHPQIQAAVIAAQEAQGVVAELTTEVAGLAERVELLDQGQPTLPQDQLEQRLVEAEAHIRDLEESNAELIDMVQSLKEEVAAQKAILEEVREAWKATEQ